MPETTDAPRRLRAADELDRLGNLLQLALTRAPGEPSVSVTFTRNAKGETQIETKVHAPGNVDHDEINRVASLAMIEAKRAYEHACAAYPTGTGFARNEGQETAK